MTSSFFVNSVAFSTIIANMALMLLIYSSQALVHAASIDTSTTISINNTTGRNIDNINTSLRSYELMSTGDPPPPKSGSIPTGTVIWDSQSAGIRFTAFLPTNVSSTSNSSLCPSNSSIYLDSITVTLSGPQYPSTAKFSVLKDSGDNSPGDLIQENIVNVRSILNNRFFFLVFNLNFIFAWIYII